MASRPEPFAGRVAVVTGGASGIGRALASELVRNGAFVTIVDASDGVDAAVDELDQHGPGRVDGARADVRDLPMLRSVVEGVRARRGRLDLMVNNAGLSEGGLTHELDIAHWHRIIDVNLFGVINGIAAAYPQMVAQRSGTIVNTASLAGLAPAVFVAAYSASKHAIVGLSGALRAEAALHGVAVVALCPGAIDTPILDAAPATELGPDAWTMTGREYMDRVGFRLSSPEQFARRALRGIARGHGVVLGSRRDHALWLLHRASPTLTDRVGRRLAARLVSAAT